MRLRRSFASGSRRLALIGVVAVLLVVVAWAVTGVRAGGTSGSARTMSPAMSGALNAVVAAAWGAGVVVLIVMVRRLRRRFEEDALEPPPTPKPWWVSAVAWLIVAAVFLIPLLIFRNCQDREPTPTAAPGSGPTSGTAEDQRRPSAWVIFGFVAGAAAAAAALAIGGQRRTDIEDDKMPLPELLHDVVGVVDDSIGDIERDPDPRHAIIRAYARMEAVLARGGIPRRPSETPLEYIDGALRSLAVPAAPARSLTDLFEIARFSDRPIDMSMKRRAIDCLLDIRSALMSEVT
jgi:cytochrome b561